MIVRKENITVGRLKTPRLCQNESGGVDFDQDVVMVEVAERSKGNSIRLFSRIGILSAL
jgi:hypothetical protein